MQQQLRFDALHLRRILQRLEEMAQQRLLDFERRLWPHRATAHPLGFETKISSDATQLLQPVLNVLQSIGATALRPSPYPPGADISGMSEAGVPALGIMSDGRTYFHYHHTAADTLDKIIPAELRENAGAMAVIAYALAQMKDPVPR